MSTSIMSALFVALVGVAGVADEDPVRREVVLDTNGCPELDAEVLAHALALELADESAPVGEWPAVAVSCSEVGFAITRTHAGVQLVRAFERRWGTKVGERDIALLIVPLLVHRQAPASNAGEAVEPRPVSPAADPRRNIEAGPTGSRRISAAPMSDPSRPRRRPGEGRPRRPNPIRKEPCMSRPDFTVTIRVERSADAVFAAINDVRGWWIGEITGPTDQLGGEFVYRHADLHRTTQRVTRLVPGTAIVWEVVDSELTFVPDRDEWTGTEIHFDIIAHGATTLVRFTHLGLVPALACYRDCSAGWTHFVAGSLRAFLTHRPARISAGSSPDSPP